jgi:hypothetical protein
MLRFCLRRLVLAGRARRQTFVGFIAAVARWSAGVAGGVSLAVAAIAAPATNPAIEWRAETVPVTVAVTGMPRELLLALQGPHADPESGGPLFRVYAEQPHSTALPPMAGTWAVRGEAFVFTPRFPLQRGVRYRAEYRPPDGAAVLSHFELPPDRTAPSTRVVQIFPSAEVLPENQLKFYVQFSAAMSRGGTYEHVHLRDAEGRKIELPFLELDEELWDPAMTRLTLLIDPGRIKRGVKPLEDIGPVFEAGHRYTLSLDAACRDAAGRPLTGAFEKAFRIGPADRAPPDPARWQIRAPAAATRRPLEVEFDEPMDQALALRLIRVETDGRPVRGDATLAPGERRWSFTPAQPWARSSHQLVVATTIEDLAGNNIGKTFDVDLAQGAPRRVAKENVSVTFVVE